MREFSISDIAFESEPDRCSSPESFSSTLIPPSNMGHQGLGAHLAVLEAVDLNHVPRVVGFANWEVDAEIAESGDAVVLRVMNESDANFSLHFTTATPNVNEVFRQSGLWSSSWSHCTDTRIVVAALAHELVPAVTRSLVLVGRAVTFREPCDTWQPTLEVWLQACGGFEAVAELDTRAVSMAFGLPEGAELGVLDASTDAELVDSTWKYTVPGKTVHWLRRSIASRPTACLRMRQDDGSMKLISWILLRHDGSLGVLHTLPDYRGKGYARAVVRYAMLCMKRWQLQQVAKGGSEAELASRAIPYCHIKTGNTASEKLFASLDFKPVDKVTWLISSAIAPRFQLRPLDVNSETEWNDLFALVNRSYRQDDAFFVDQQRTDMDNLKEMAKEGCFYLGYRWNPDAESDVGIEGLESRAYPAAVRTNFDASLSPAAAAARPQLKQPRESDHLLCSVYVKIDVSSDAAHSAPFRHLAPSSPSAHAVAPPSPSASEASSQASPSASSSPASSGGPVAHLGMLTIDPQYKKLGIGQRVLDFVLDTAKAAHGCVAAEAFVVSVKPWLQDWYRRNGFEYVGQAPWPAEMEYQLVLPTFFHIMKKAL